MIAERKSGDNYCHIITMIVFWAIIEKTLYLSFLGRRVSNNYRIPRNLICPILFNASIALSLTRSVVLMPKAEATSNRTRHRYRSSLLFFFCLIESLLLILTAILLPWPLPLGEHLKAVLNNGQESESSFK